MMAWHRDHCLLHLRIVSFQTLMSTGVFSEVNFSPGNKTLIRYHCSSRNQKAREQNAEALHRITKASFDLLNHFVQMAIIVIYFQITDYSTAPSFSERLR